MREIATRILGAEAVNAIAPYVDVIGVLVVIAGILVVGIRNWDDEDDDDILPQSRFRFGLGDGASSESDRSS